jgi:thiol:disulfide interchange protein DsbA
MRATRPALVMILALTLAACGRQSAAPATTSEPAQAQATTAGTPAPQPQKPVIAQTESSTVTRVNEDGSETVEDTSGDSGTHNALLAAVASTAAAATTAPASNWQEGVNYTRMVPAQPTSVPDGQVEVLEVFWYACPHCYALDPLVEAWKKKLPPYVSFSRVPVTWGEGHRSLARFYYALESIGKLNQLHSAIFKEIHVNGNPLVDVGNDSQKSEEIQTAFVEKFGVSAAEFQKAYHSFGVETSLQRAEQLTERYRITGVPTFVVNGKYITDVGMAQGEERLLQLISDLAAQEHRR